GLIERELWPERAFSPETIERARSVKTTVTKTATKVAAQPVAQTSARQVKKEEAVAVPVVPVKEEEDEAVQLDELFARLTVAADHYQVLGVRRTAAAGEIKSSYHRLAKRFHPDRFHKDEQLHARVEEAFARIAQAYETLKDKQSRAVYDLKLSQPNAPQTVAAGFQQSGGANRESVADVVSQENAALMRQAENSFQRGLLSLKQGKPTAAISSFSEAARLVPREARYRAYHGRALAENEATWRQAEAEMKAAISFDSKNVDYYVMLAEFYLKVGLPRRAQSELERALVLDSQNATARQLLASIQATLKGQR
ncbi:MAG: DnaJ domain-containing protein, partial [Pyrinomonadaceae bacterium]|nr:DnaJ domain-containing protein [Pyrinomonadaceae bacterium]